MKTKIHSKIKMHLHNIKVIEKYKKLNMMEHKTDMNSNKYKKQNMEEHKTDMNINKNWSQQSTKQIWILLRKTLIMTEHKTGMNVTKCKTLTWRNTKQTHKRY